MRYAPAFENNVQNYVSSLIYAWKRDVLDAGGKDGFGSQILANVAKSITIADIEDEWLKDAERIGGYRCPTKFVKSNFEKEFPEGDWDTIIALEVIEHLENPEFFLENAAKHLRPNGRIVIATPHMVANREHKTLFDKESLWERVSEHFEVISLVSYDRCFLSQRPLHKGITDYFCVGVKK